MQCRPLTLAWARLALGVADSDTAIDVLRRSVACEMMERECTDTIRESVGPWSEETLKQARPTPANRREAAGPCRAALVPSRYEPRFNRGNDSSEMGNNVTDAAAATACRVLKLVFAATGRVVCQTAAIVRESRTPSHPSPRQRRRLKLPSAAKVRSLTREWTGMQPVSRRAARESAPCSASADYRAVGAVTVALQAAG